MAVTTRRQLESMIAHVRDALIARGVAGVESMALDDRGPDYPFRYSVVLDGGRAYAFASRYYRAGELWDCLQMTLRALQLVAVGVPAGPFDSFPYAGTP